MYTEPCTGIAGKIYSDTINFADLNRREVTETGSYSDSKAG